MRKVITGKRIVLVLVLLVAAWTAWFVYSYGFVEVEATGFQDGAEVQVAGGDSTLTAKLEDGNVRKLVKKGEYYTKVLDGESGSVARTVVSGLLRTSKIEITAASPHTRQAIANNPSRCMTLSPGDVLLSWNCGRSVSGGQIHIPPSNTLPGYIQPFTNFDNPSTIEGVVMTSSGVKVLVRLNDIDEASHVLYPLKPDHSGLDISSPITVSSLDPEKNYVTARYREGYLLLSRDGSEAKYYRDMLADPESLAPPSIDNTEVTPYSVSALDERLLYTYTNSSTPEFEGHALVLPSYVNRPEYIEDEDEGVKIDTPNITETTVVVVQDPSTGSQQQFTLDYISQQTRLCANDYLCTLEAETLRIYRIGEDLELISSFAGVKQIATLNNQLILVDEGGVLFFDPSKLSGYYSYLFPAESTFCGIQTLENDYLLCANHNSLRLTLKISPGAEAGDKVDRYVFGLHAKPNVTNLSAYKNIIYVSYDMGERTYQPDIDGFGYSAAQEEAAKSSIQQYVEELGINTSRYRIITPF